MAVNRDISNWLPCCYLISYYFYPAAIAMLQQHNLKKTRQVLSEIMMRI
jgi:hypothetical protein